MLKTTLPVALFFLILMPREAAPNAREQARIDFLLQQVASSQAMFIRNGVEYNAVDAVAHLRLKLQRAGKRINTAEHFIDYLASKSSVSGQAYRLKWKDGKTADARTWLYQKLKEFK